MKHLVFVQQLRGIAALFVVLFHLEDLLNRVYAQKHLGSDLFYSGAFGVDLFFIISGFIICHSTQRPAHARPVDFAIRRFFRIYPAFALSIAVIVLTYGHSASAATIGRSLILLHENYNARAPFFGYNLNFPAWTITYELFFYGVFCTSLAFTYRYRTWVASAALVIMVLGLQLLFNGSVALSGRTTAHVFAEDSAYAPIKLGSSPLLLEFVVGMLLYELFSKTGRTLWPPTSVTLWLCLPLFLAMYATRYRYGHGLDDFGLWALLLFIGCMVAEKNGHLNEIPALTFLGDISYSLYISHTVVFKLMEKYRTHIPIFATHKGFPALIIALIPIFLCAWVLHVTVEKPCIKIGKVLSKKIRASEIGHVSARESKG